MPPPGHKAPARETAPVKLRLRAAVLALGLIAPPAAAAPQVAADVAPVHSIVARVMTGVGEPGLILPPGASPHGHALRPSEARRLQEADLVVWVGPALTPWLADPIATLAPGAALLTLAEAPGVETLPMRAGGPFEAHGDDEPDVHAPVATDGHIWLDPDNAVAAAQAVADALAGLDPGNAAIYAANRDDFAAETVALTRSLVERLAPLRGRPYLVFHDGYQYFERRFDLPSAGSVALHDADAPGTARIAAIRDRVRAEGVVCAFAEPEFEPALLATVIEGTAARLGTLDGLGAGLEPGPDLYPALVRGLADGLEACLAP
jgi:zinc transport system substrate-binding protein